MKTTQTYSEYTYYLYGRADAWGPEATDDEAEEYSARWAQMLRAEFPGLVVERTVNLLHRRVDGPERDICLLIEDWAEAHWIEAIVEPPAQGGVAIKTIHARDRIARALALSDRLTTAMLAAWEDPERRERLRVQRNVASVLARRAAGDWTQYLDGAPISRALLRRKAE